MAKNDITVYEKIEKHLFHSIDETKLALSEKDQDIKKRVLLCVSKKMANPLMMNSELISFLMEGGSVELVEKDKKGKVISKTMTDVLFTPVSQSQAYNDIAGITKIFGNITISAKSWHRHIIVETCKKGAQIAIEDRDPQGIAANMDKIGKYTRADKEDDVFDWNEMIPPSFEPTDDITVLEGIREIPNLEEERRRFREKFKGNLFKKAEEAQIEP